MITDVPNPPKVPLAGLHHVAVHVHDLDRARRFYTDVLGLTEVRRPELGLPGAWLAVGDHPDQMIHLMVTGDDPPATLQHFALSCPDLAAAAEALAAHGYELGDPSPIPGHGRQAFVRDPEGNLVELNEPEPAPR